MSNESAVKKGLQKGLGKMEIITQLIRNDEELDLASAGAIYKAVAEKEGYLLSSAQVAELLATIAASHVDNETKTLDRKAAVEELMEKARLQKPAATARLAAFCEENDIAFPKAIRVARDMDAVKAYYKQYFTKVDRPAMEKALQDNFSYTEKNVGQAYLAIGKELGLIEQGTASGRHDLASWFADAENVAGEKKEIIERLMASTGVAKATAETRYGMYLFAKSYHQIVSAA